MKSQKISITQNQQKNGIIPPKYLKKDYDFWEDWQLDILVLLLKKKSSKAIARKVQRINQPKKVQITKLNI